MADPRICIRQTSGILFLTPGSIRPVCWHRNQTLQRFSFESCEFPQVHSSPFSFSLQTIIASQELSCQGKRLFIYKARSSINRFDLSSNLGKVPSGTVFTIVRKPKAFRIAELTAVAVSAGLGFVDST